MRRFLAPAIAVLLASLGHADAWLIQGVVSSYIGPGDLQTYTAWYGTRAYSRAVAVSAVGKSVRIRNTSSGELCDVKLKFDGSQGFTTNCTSTGAGQSISAFCGAVDCGVQTFYDQLAGNACGGASCDLVQNTSANQPLLLASDSYSTVAFTSSTAAVTSANNFTPSAAKLTLSVVYNRYSGNQQIRPLHNIGSNNRIQAGAGAAQIAVFGGTSGSSVITSSDAAWHGDVAVINGASVSGISTATASNCTLAASVTASTTAAAPAINTNGQTSTSFKVYEVGFIDNYAISVSDCFALNANPKTYWGY